MIHKSDLIALTLEEAHYFDPPSGCYQHPEVSGAYCARHEAVPDWFTEITYRYKGVPGWVCPIGHESLQDIHYYNPCR